MKTFKLFLACTLTAGFLFAQTDYQQQGDEILQQAIENEECIGLAAGFSINGEASWASGAGFSEVESEAPFTEETLSRIASIAKPMTAVAILQLHEQGKIDLDASIQTYLPNFPRHPEGDITVRRLLGHGSGIGAYQSGKERENQTHYPTLEDAMTIFQDRSLAFQPGTAFGYTSYGYVVLGRVIEEVSGLSYEEYLRTHIWEPAGMEHTGIEVAGENYPGKAALYHRRDNGKIRPAKATDLSDRVPGGGLYSTVTDLLRFGDAVLDGRLITAESLALMMQDNGLKTEGNPYGLGWYLYGENPNYGPVIGHTGGQTGCSAMLMLLPEAGTSIIVLSNTSGAMQTVSSIAVQLFGVADAARE